MKPILLVLIAFLAYARVADWLEGTGLLLCQLHNLPHRGLGMMYAAHIMRPERADYAREYCRQWFVAVAQDRLAEGSRRPVVPMLAARLARQFPTDPEMQTVALWCRMQAMGKVVLK